MKSMSEHLMTLAVMGAAVLLIAGCQEPGMEFPPEHAISPPEQAAAVQVAAGSRQDATLYAHHFDGNQLNELGQAKLDLMLPRASSPPKVDVYMDMPEDAAMAPRKSAVEKYLKGAGIATVEMRSGPNPGTLTPAAPALAREPRAESAPERTVSPRSGAGESRR